MQQAKAAPLLSLLLCSPPCESVVRPATGLVFQPTASKSVGEPDYPETGLVIVGGDSAELWTPNTLVVNSDDSKNLKNGGQHNGE